MKTVLAALNEALVEAMDADDRVVVIGEDILDPYGGAFKVTRGLSTRFPDRVYTTPISECAITGVATGMALRGFRPVVEIMFGDFLGLTFDQVLNHAAKFRWMYNGQVRAPIVIRTPMGGRRGYGPTHSQSTEKFFLGIPGLRVVAPNTLADPRPLLVDCIRNNEDPLLFVEHKLLYTRPVRTAAEMAGWEARSSGSSCPVIRLQLRGAPPPTVTIASYGYMTELVLEAVSRLAIEREVFAEAVIFTEISPLAAEPLLESVAATGRLLTVEEGSRALGWGSEVAASVAERHGGKRPLAIRRVAARDVAIPSSRKLEDAVLPGIEDIIAASIAAGG